MDGWPPETGSWRFVSKWDILKFTLRKAGGGLHKQPPF